jgi:hypothetical protein
MGRVDPAGVQRPRIRSFDLPLPIPSSRAGRPGSPDQGDLPDARPLRVPARRCPPAPRRLGDQLEENSSDLQRVGPSTAQQDAEAKSQGEASRRSSRSFHFERCLGHGLRPRPIGYRSEDPRPDRRGYVQPVLACARSEVQLPGRRHRCDPGTRLRDNGLSEDDPSRSGNRVRQPGSISGPTRTASPWTSHAPENRPTTPSLRRSTGASGRSALTRTGS